MDLKQGRMNSHHGQACRFPRYRAGENGYAKSSMGRKRRRIRKRALATDMQQIWWVKLLRGKGLAVADVMRQGVGDCGKWLALELFVASFIVN